MNDDDLEEIFGGTRATGSRSFRDMHWRTKDGRTVPIREMADQHLMNAIRYYRRQVKDDIIKRIVGRDPLTPDQIEMKIHHELFKHHAQYAKAYKEAVIRGLIVDMKCLMTEIEAKDLEYTPEPKSKATGKSLFNMSEFLNGPEDPTIPDV